MADVTDGDGEATVGEGEVMKLDNGVEVGGSCPWILSICFLRPSALA